jgi:hypothetical protein
MDFWCSGREFEPLILAPSPSLFWVCFLCESNHALFLGGSGIILSMAAASYLIIRVLMKIYFGARLFIDKLSILSSIFLAGFKEDVNS